MIRITWAVPLPVVAMWSDSQSISLAFSCRNVSSSSEERMQIVDPRFVQIRSCLTLSHHAWFRCWVQWVGQLADFILPPFSAYVKMETAKSNHSSVSNSPSSNGTDQSCLYTFIRATRMVWFRDPYQSTLIKYKKKNVCGKAKYISATVYLSLIPSILWQSLYVLQYITFIIRITHSSFLSLRLFFLSFYFSLSLCFWPYILWKKI